MEVRIRETSHGGYIVEAGRRIEATRNPFGYGSLMPGFIAYRSEHADTLREAKQVAKRIAK